MKKIFYSGLALLLFGAATAKAQDTVETSIGTDFVSSYVWRGLELGDVSMQPTLGISYKGLSLSAWGSVGLSNPTDTKELDLTLAYSAGGFNVGVTDYWFNAGLDPLNRYFKYAADETNHVFEANIGYDFGFASLQWYTNFSGNDGVNKDGDRAYSSYVEANVPFKLGGCEWQATVGAVPFYTDYYGAEGFIINNVSLRADRDIKITDSFSLPVFAQIMGNPSTEHAYFVFGFTLKAF